jgi:hypothetical protein
LGRSIFANSYPCLPQSDHLHRTGYLHVFGMFYHQTFHIREIMLIRAGVVARVNEKRLSCD